MDKPPEAKWIRFDERPTQPPRKTRRFYVVALNANADHLGVIEWYGPWRCYAFTPASTSLVFEHRCLKDLAAFLEWLMDQRRKERANVQPVKPDLRGPSEGPA